MFVGHDKLYGCKGMLEAEGNRQEELARKARRRCHQQVALLCTVGIHDKRLKDTAGQRRAEPCITCLYYRIAIRRTSVKIQCACPGPFGR